MYREAVEGTLSVMRACQETQVRRLCVTSSVVAMTMKAHKPAVWDESHYSDPNWSGIGAYEKSKTLADQASWDFYSRLPADNRFEFSTVNPCMIFGPSLVNDLQSAKIVDLILMGKFIKGLSPKMSLGICDVRDVAQAHLKCLELDAAQGKRFLIANESLWLREIADVLRKRYGQYGYPIVSSEECDLDSWKKAAAKAGGVAVKIVERWGHISIYNNSRSRDILGIRYRSIDETLCDNVESMIKLGLIKDLRPQPKL